MLSPMTSAEKVRAFRERAREAGLCQVCGQRKPWRQLTICRYCNDEAKARNQLQRKFGASHVRDLFCALVEALSQSSTDIREILTDEFLEESGFELDRRSNRAVARMTSSDRVKWLIGALWHCTSIVPSEYRDILDMPNSSRGTYSAAVRWLTNPEGYCPYHHLLDSDS